MHEQLTRFDHEGDADLLARQARAAIAQEMKRVVVSAWRRLVTTRRPADRNAPAGMLTPTR